MINVLVTGGKGQLASSLKDLTRTSTKLNFLYKSSQELDITNFKSLDTFFRSNSIDYCVNCAAYTAVDDAETEVELATMINEIGAKNISNVCEQYDTILIHISTDFVFDGLKSHPYTELDSTNPQSIYGLSKLKGELEIHPFVKQRNIKTLIPPIIRNRLSETIEKQSLEEESN